METKAAVNDAALTVNVSTAARMLGISRTYAFQLAREGRLPGSFRVGSRIVVSREVIERLCAGGEEPARGAP